MSFSKLGLSGALLREVEKAGFEVPYPIQEKVIPAVLEGNDILGIAKTGSGKTAAFVLPILDLMQKASALKSRHVHTLVLVPTRELAMQVAQVFKQFSTGLDRPVKILAVYGGVSINPQMMQIQGTGILVATPGRLLDLMDSNAVHLTAVEILLLDEADKMLNLGFKEEIDKILIELPKRRQNLLFSATLGEEIEAVKNKLLLKPLVVEIQSEAANVDLITQKAYKVSAEKKGNLLRYLIRNFGMRQVLVFTSSTHRADHVVVKLNKHGLNSAALHSKRSQGARTSALSKFKKGELKILVATDLASRGIDIQFLPFVINYELPRSPTDYVHRIGRTGRAESPGVAISLVSPEEEHHFKIIQKKMGKQVEIIETDELNLQGQ